MENKQVKSNTSKGRGVKGSKYWMQVVVEKDELREELEQKIGEKLRWISPLAGENEVFLEYQLNQQIMLDELGITKDEAKDIFDFWPQRQPQWDGLAVSEDGKTMYLIEAKAHLKELDSKLSASSEESRNQIIKSMTEVKESNYSMGDFAAWEKKYYQLGNRLTFLYKMNELKDKFSNIDKFKLVLLNFANDDTHIPTREEEWVKHYEEVFETMIGYRTAPEDMLVINYDVEGICDKG